MLKGVFQEKLRVVEARVKIGRFLFARLKESRKLLGSAQTLDKELTFRAPELPLSDYEREYGSAIGILSKAEEDANLSIDDAKTQFVLNLLMFGFSAIGVGYILFITLAGVGAF